MLVVERAGKDGVRGDEMNAQRSGYIEERMGWDGRLGEGKAGVNSSWCCW